ncbi:putative ribonuclease Jc [Hartmannibacter diazotrophicus]|uniref:Putative ribonuclease Jc n=1 Tax=Hartmannibacter diazotrophicus TaxID=1482074 RepID=A0A2C9D3W8_9HYPH|nr:ribonuclease J [Hartmannibacter diazotrophicus]SON54923.1 putative ribonuclease Jc [Hartmannibacter diazotrophicus]
MSEPKDDLVFLPLGGVGEIGMNLGLYGMGPAHRRKWLMVDCGVSFAGPDLPGIDLITPDIAFIEQRREDLVGIVITHAHEDHFGALYDLWPRLGVPVYMTPFAAALHDAKRAMERNAPKIETQVVQQGQHFSVGPFDLEFVPVSHSLPEPNSLVLRTPFGTVLHTGDWKIDMHPVVGKPIDLPRFEEIGAEGVLAMVCDSTNAPREGTSPSEGDVAEGIADVVAKAKGRVAVTIFASNVARIRSVAEAARAADREVIIVGRAIRRAVDVASELGYLDDLPPFRDEEAYGYLPPDKVVALVTGSQGESRAALAKLAFDEHRNVTLSRGDTVVFSSRTIPGNEKAVGAIKNALVDRGVKLVTDADALVHTSGHPRADEIRRLYGIVKPKTAVPVHGESVHLAAHADIARKCGVPKVVTARNGKVLRLAPGEPEIIDTVPSGILVKDGYLLKSPEVSGVQERRRVSFAGAMSIVVLLDETSEIAGEPIVTLFGLPESDAGGELFQELIENAVEGAVVSIPRLRRRDESLVAEAVRRAARAKVNERWGKKPLCDVVVARV